MRVVNEEQIAEMETLHERPFWERAVHGMTWTSAALVGAVVAWKLILLIT
jgi:hypothetical protein